MPAHSLDLVLSPASDDLIRSRWAALHGAGLPSLATHRGASNAPHITALSTPALPEHVLDRSRELFSTLLPCSVDVAGLLILGHGPFVLAESVIVPSGVTGAVRELERIAAESRPQARPWVPHLTLGKRLTAAQVGEALDVLADVPTPRTVEVTGLRRWDPEHRVTAMVVG
ncbi:2'-5' RNA ligase family protein [Kocuria marina]|uniref:2'-5' RNA ligase family protein n=1 Tax=Kocuria marina TaxID=223184 RepID=UPI0022E635CE|nr:2'-5' RNA ligase family protein [Kocuria marina]